MKNPTLVKNLFSRVVQFICKKAGCVYLRVYPQNVGLMYTLPYYNENFDIQTMEVGSGAEAGQLSKGRGCS